MSRDVEVDNASSVMRQNDKDEENFKPNSVHSEEIDGSKLRYVIVEERSPCLGWRFWMSDHVFGNGSLRDCDAEFLKFAADARRPQRALSRLSWRMRSRVSSGT